MSDYAETTCIDMDAVGQESTSIVRNKGGTKNDSQNNPTTNDTENVEFEPDLFILFYLLLSNQQEYKSLSLYEKARWWSSVIFVLIIQIFCLIILCVAYLQQYSSSSSDTKYVISKNQWVLLESPVHSCCAIASIMVLLSYLTSSAVQSAKLLSVTLHLTNKSKKKLLFRYGVIISILNLLLIESTWSISLIVIYYSLYNQTDNPAEVVLASVGNVFILEIDDYFCKYFQDTFLFKPKEWSIKANKSKFEVSYYYFIQFCVFGLVMWIIVWSLVSSEFYNDFTVDQNGAVRTLIISQVSFVIFLVPLGTVVLVSNKWRYKALPGAYLFASGMNIFQYIMILFVADDNGTAVGFALNECGIGSETSLTWYCIVSHPLMFIAICTFILICWSKVFKESVLNKYSKRLFIIYEVTSLIGLCIWRFKSDFYNEGCYAIAFCYGAAFIQFYLKQFLDGKKEDVDSE